MESFVSKWIESLMDSTNLQGYSILLMTAPLAIIQGLFGVFPFVTLILIHVSVLGIAQGMLASWAIGSFASIIVFILSRYLLFDWFNRRFGHRMQRYQKWQKYMDVNGTWILIFLRTLPIMPNNLISFMGAISNMKLSSYILSSIIGNLSHIWLFGLLSAAIVMPGRDITWLSLFYILFCALLSVVFGTMQSKRLREHVKHH